MEKDKIARINELAKKETLTDAEKAEQKSLREEYIRDFRAQFSDILEHTSVQYPDGKKVRLQKKSK